VLAMYHDQGLPVLKYKGFGRAVNISLGLPIIRTSVDHGTALDLAGTGQADGVASGKPLPPPPLWCDSVTASAGSVHEPAGGAGHQARKRFGQNFLHDAGVLDRIVGSHQSHAGR